MFRETWRLAQYHTMRSMDQGTAEVLWLSGNQPIWFLIYRLVLTSVFMPEMLQSFVGCLSNISETAGMLMFGALNQHTARAFEITVAYKVLIAIENYLLDCTMLIGRKKGTLHKSTKCNVAKTDRLMQRLIFSSVNENLKMLSSSLIGIHAFRLH